jgi:hypothetical protein
MHFSYFKDWIKINISIIIVEKIFTIIIYIFDILSLSYIYLEKWNVNFSSKNINNFTDYDIIIKQKYKN